MTTETTITDDLADVCGLADAFAVKELPDGTTEGDTLLMIYARKALAWMRSRPSPASPAPDSAVSTAMVRRAVEFSTAPAKVDEAGLRIDIASDLHYAHGVKAALQLADYERFPDAIKQLDEAADRRIREALAARRKLKAMRRVSQSPAAGVSEEKT